MKTIGILLLGTALSFHPRPLQAGLPAPRPFVLVVERGQQAPVPAPAGPATFSAVTNAVTNARGDVVFRAQLNGTGITSANNEGLYMRNAAGTITRIIGEGDIVPDVNLPLLFVGAQHNLLDDGTTVFQAIFGQGATLGTDGVMLQATPGQPVKTLLREGQPIGATGFNVGPSSIEPGTGVPPQPPFAIGDINGDGSPDVIALADAVDVVATGGGPAQAALIYFLDGVVQLGVKEGDPVPGLEGQVFSDNGFGFSIGGISLNNGITFLGSGASGLPLGIFQQPLDGPVRSLLLNGDKAASFGNGFVFDGFNEPTVGSDGSVLVSANAIKEAGGGTPQFRTGLFQLSADGNGKPILIAARDRGAAGIPGQVVYSGFGEIDTLATGKGLLKGVNVELFNRKKPADPLAEALYVGDRSLKLIAREGGPAPGAGPSVTVKELDSLTSDDFVNLYWIALLLDDDEEFEAVFDSFLDGKKPNTGVLLRVPSVLDFGAAGTRTVTDVLPFPTVARSSGAPQLASPSGLVLSCNFKEGPGGGILFCPENDPPIYRPDIIVQNAKKFLGDNRYMVDGQKLKFEPTAPAMIELVIILQNDGNIEDNLVFKARPPVFSGADRAVSFFDNGVDVSGDVFGALGFKTGILPPSGSTTVTMRIVLPPGFRNFDIPGQGLTSNAKVRLLLGSSDEKVQEDNFQISINAQ